MKKLVFFFGEKPSRNEQEALRIVGNKGFRLSEMSLGKLPVPMGFTVSSEACAGYYSSGKRLSRVVLSEIKQGLFGLEKKTGKKFGSASNPLLVSVRYSSYYAMPGLMDSVLNVGLNDETLEGTKKTAGEKTALDSYRRLIEVFGVLVEKIPAAEFHSVLAEFAQEKNGLSTSSLSLAQLEKIVSAYKKVFEKHSGKQFPQDAFEQIVSAAIAVFDSWGTEKAVAFRRMNSLDDKVFTACIVQEMVFGNRGTNSGTGVVSTRNPFTGEKELFGELILNAQGEDITSGQITPKPISLLGKKMPNVFSQLEKISRILEKKYKSAQEMEFTIDNGRLFLLETRQAELSAKAKARAVVGMHREGLLSKKEAVLAFSAKDAENLLHKQFEKNEKNSVPIAKGIPASPGAVSGIAAFSEKKALEYSQSMPKKQIVLVKHDTTPEDIEGLNVAHGILTAVGGSTSHAAVVSRGMGKACIVGCKEIHIGRAGNSFSSFNGTDITVKEGDSISIDGSTGEVFAGEKELADPVSPGEFLLLLKWADSLRKLAVRANADTARDARKAREFGAKGIGLCRTEHMFFEEERIQLVRKMILADSFEERKQALDALLPFQKKDFAGIFSEMKGMPVTIRLLDPPLHEFLPRYDKNLKLIAEKLGITEKKLQEKIRELHESNPMLGFRGCRLGVVYPEINEMQVRAIIDAAIEAKKQGKKVFPEIMIPIVSSAKEMELMKQLVERIAGQVMKEKNARVSYKVGCMIELPSAALIAEKLAENSEFFSFGTNDLTQTTLGFSRDDAGKFLQSYVTKGVIAKNPFETIEFESVGELMRIAVQKIRKHSKNASIGICGEHGGDPESIAFAHSIGLDYVSCSPYRVPIARLAVAHAALNRQKKSKHYSKPIK